MTLFCGFDLELPEPFKSLAFGELPLWEKYYLPVDPKGLVVLDIGAGVGETAAFYLAHGAEKVVSIQPRDDPSLPGAVSVLRRNAARLGSVEVVEGKFALEHMEIPHGLLKMDCEGGEVQLYDPGWSGELKPCVIEAHGNDVMWSLCQKFPLKPVFSLTHDHWGLWFLHPKSSPLEEFVWNRALARPMDDMEYMKRFEPEEYLRGPNPFIPKQ